MVIKDPELNRLVGLQTIEMDKEPTPDTMKERIKLHKEIQARQKKLKKADDKDGS